MKPEDSKADGPGHSRAEDPGHSRPEVVAVVVLALLAFATLVLAVIEIRAGAEAGAEAGAAPGWESGRESVLEGSRVWQPGPPLPEPVANNAVVGLRQAGGAAVFSFLGIDSTKVWSGVVNWAFRWDVGEASWTVIEPVPGPGRLAATAQAWDGRVYLFGGYTVAADGSEASLANVDVYDPAKAQWSRGAPIPVPVDDAVSGIWQDSLIVLVSGWHDTGNVPDVQIYDPANDTWMEATPTPGPPVFGHAGAVSGDVLLYRDGAMVRDETPRFVLTPTAWRGDLDPSDPATISWREETAPRSAPRSGPRAALYRSAATGIGDWILFVGGTDNPYNYDGLGYDGRPAEARADVWGYHVPTGRWVDGPRLPLPSMDHRALANAGHAVVLAGGMDSERRVSDRVWIASVEAIQEALSDALSDALADPLADGTANQSSQN